MTAKGLNTQLNWGISVPDQERTVEALRDLGAEWIRYNVNWRVWEYEGEGMLDLDYLAEEDATIALAKEAGLKILLVVIGSPDWAGGIGGSRPKPPTDPADYGAAVEFAVDRWEPDAVQVWNEPNLPPSNGVGWYPTPDPAEYVEVLKAGYEGAKAADPAVPVLAFAVSGGDYEFVEDCYSASRPLALPSPLDTFDRADENPLAAPWVPLAGYPGLRLVGGAAKSTVGYVEGHLPDQYAGDAVVFLTYSELTTDPGDGVDLLLHVADYTAGSNDATYDFYVSNTDWNVVRYRAPADQPPSFDMLMAFVGQPDPVAGERLALRTVGEFVEAWRDHGTGAWERLGRVEDTELRSGSIGFAIDGPGGVIDDFGGGEIVVPSDLGASFDVASCHPYALDPNDKPPDTITLDGNGRIYRYTFPSYREVRASLAANGNADKPLWATEFGWATYSAGVSEKRQAQYLVRAYEMFVQDEVPVALWYQERNNVFGADSDAWIDRLGLMLTDFTPKLAYAAFKRVGLGEIPEREGVDTLQVIRRAYPRSQELLAGPPDRIVTASTPVGWYGTDVHPETGAVALVRSGSELAELIGEVIRLRSPSGEAYALVVSGSSDLTADLCVARRCFLDLAPLADRVVDMEVAVI